MKFSSQLGHPRRRKKLISSWCSNEGKAAAKSKKNAIPPSVCAAVSSMASSTSTILLIIRLYSMTRVRRIPMVSIPELCVLGRFRIMRVQQLHWFAVPTKQFPQ
eukprot:5161381-Pyramimonas_sp.AAC.1